jgi:GAF domain-containing protein
MAERLTIQAGPHNKKALYAELEQAIRQIILQEKDETAIMSVAASVLCEGLGFHWIGFYRVVGERLLVGPYQGPIACMEIPFGKGVCGKAWESNATLVVPDVGAFPGHIACSSLSRSEIVIPLRDKAGIVRAVLDIDSEKPDDFSLEDQAGLEKIANLLSASIYG